jgi:hypothetical protein
LAVRSRSVPCSVADFMLQAAALGDRDRQIVGLGG